MMIGTYGKSVVHGSNTPDNNAGADRSAAGKFLTFSLDREEYGIEILRVREIIGMLPITSVPGTPDHFRGIINLRGQIIPVIDLRRRFEMESKAQTPETCIIVVDVQEVAVGMVVDRVLEVLNIAAEDIEPVPSFGKNVNTNLILGMGKSQSKLTILLNIDRLIADEQAIHFQTVPETETVENAQGI
jgi:purine-binding chemotaxis protein CheW